MLGALMRRLATHHHQVAVDDGWGDWDLEVATGTWSRARVTLAEENHGGTKRLLRVRCGLLLSRAAHAVLGGCGLLAVLGALGASRALVAAAAAAALALAGTAGLRLGRFADEFHHLVEAAAAESGLVPVDPIARPVLPATAPRTA